MDCKNDECLIERIEDKASIADLLNEFTPCLESLSSGRVDIGEQAEKFSRHASVLRLSCANRSIGFAAFYHNDSLTRTAYLSMIAIKPEYARRGYGIMLLKYVEGIAEASGMSCLKLEVLRTNLSAQSFYSKLGYNMFKETDDSVYMEKNIEQRLF